MYETRTYGAMGGRDTLLYINSAVCRKVGYIVDMKRFWNKKTVVSFILALLIAAIHKNKIF